MTSGKTAISDFLRLHGHRVFGALALTALIVSIQRELTWGEGTGRLVLIGTEGFIAGGMGPVFNARPGTRGLLLALRDAGVAFDESMLIVMLAAVLAAVVATWLAIRETTGSELSADAGTCGVALATMAGFTTNGFNISMPYDFPMLAFSAAGIIAVLRRHRLGFAVVILAGTFFKETTFWLLAAWPLVGYARGEQTRRLIFDTLHYAALFILVYFGCRVLTAGTEPSPLVTVSPAFWDPGQMSLRPRIALNFETLMMADKSEPLLSPWWVAGLWTLSLWRCREHKVLIMLHIAALAHMLPMLVVGNLRELRIFYEILPVIGTGLSIPPKSRISGSEKD